MEEWLAVSSSWMAADKPSPLFLSLSILFGILFRDFLEFIQAIFGGDLEFLC